MMLVQMVFLKKSLKYAHCNAKVDRWKRQIGSPLSSFPVEWRHRQQTGQLLKQYGRTHEKTKSVREMRRRMTLGQKLKALLKEKNMTQEELAEQIDVSRQAVGKWANDKGIPEVGKLIQISNLFGVSLDYLLKEDSRDVAGAESGYYVSGEMLEGYLSYRKQNRKRIIGGISLLMLANIFDGSGAGSARSVIEGLYWIVTLAGVALLIWQCFQNGKYWEIKKEKLIFDDKVYAAFKARREQQRKKYALMMIAGVVLLVMGSEMDSFLVHNTVFRISGIEPGTLEWITDTAGLAFVMWSAMSAMAESVVVKNAEGLKKSGHGRFRWIYWAVPVTVLAVVIGAVSHIWSPMAPVIVLFCALLVAVCKLLLENQGDKS